MSPMLNRRGFFNLAAASVATVAVPASIARAEPEPTEYERWIAVRDALLDIRERFDSDHMSYRLADLEINLIGMRLIRLCPHDRQGWIFHGPGPTNPNVGTFTCPACQASWEFPHIDGRYDGPPQER